MQVMRSAFIQHLAAFFDDILCRFGGLAGTDSDLQQMRPVDFTYGQVFQFLQNVLPLDRGSRHISRLIEFGGFCKQILNSRMAERIGVEQYMSFVHQKEQIIIRIKPRCLQCLNGTRQGIVGDAYLQGRMGTGIVDDLLFGYSLVNAQDGNVVLAVNALVLHQGHIGHGNNSRNGVADGQFGSSASCLLLVK